MLILFRSEMAFVGYFFSELQKCLQLALLLTRSLTMLGAEGIFNNYSCSPNKAEGRMGYWLRGYEGERNTCFSKIHLVGQENIETNYLALV